MLLTSILEQLTKSVDIRSIASIDEDNCVPIIDGIGIGIYNVYFLSLVKLQYHFNLVTLILNTKHQLIFY